MKRATAEQLEMSGFIEERLEEIELHMLSNAEPLNQYMSDSPYLPGHIPDKWMMIFLLFSLKTPENFQMYSICTQKA